MGIDRFVGLDLAWRESRPGLAANETGVAVLDPDGRVVDAGWTRGLDETVEWVVAAAGESALLFVDAPLVVDNPGGQRACETQVGQRYWRWKVSANTTNLRSPRLAGVALRRRLEHRAGGTVTATVDHRRTGAGAPSATHTRRWSAPPSWATTSSGRGTSASHAVCRPRSGGRYGRPPATTSSNG